MDISIITPVYNAGQYTQIFLDSLKTALSNTDLKVETIIIDNYSYDETPGILQKIELPGLKLERSRENLGFARGSNAGAKKATGKYLLFLNNDMFVFPGSLEALFREMERSEATGILGGRLLYPDHTIQHAGMAFNEDHHCLHVFRHYPAEHPLVLQKRTFQAVTGACIFIRRTDFEALEGFDESFVNGYEDIDLCLRLKRSTGKEIVYLPDAVFLHYESVSEGRHLAQAGAWKRFKEKWEGKIQSDYADKTTGFLQTFQTGLIAKKQHIWNSPENYKPAENTKESCDLNRVISNLHILQLDREIKDLKLQNQDMHHRIEELTDENRSLYRQADDLKNAIESVKQSVSF